MLIIVSIAVALLFAILVVRYRAPDNSRFDHPKTTPLIADKAVSAAHDEVVAKLAAYTSNRTTNIAEARRRMEELFFRDIDAQIQPVDVAGIPGEWVLADGVNPARRLLYLHGGAFRVGSPRSHRFLTGELSRRLGVAVLAIDYRMQPEFKTIACHEDARTAYRWILENGPAGEEAAEELLVAGDSAGGNLTLSVIAWARDQGIQAATAAIAFAPLTDATLASPTWRSNVKTDPFLGPGIGKLTWVPLFLVGIIARFSGGIAATEPMVSPLLGNLEGLPPTLIQVSRDEMLYADAQRYANKALAAGNDLTLQVWPRLVHVFQGFPELPETEDALRRVTAFVESRRAPGLPMSAVTQG